MATNLFCKNHVFNSTTRKGLLLCSECGVWLDGKDIRFKCPFCKEEFKVELSEEKKHFCKVDWDKKRYVEVAYKGGK